jgi:hypothetical protein
MEAAQKPISMCNLCLWLNIKIHARPTKGIRDFFALGLPLHVEATRLKGFRILQAGHAFSSGI